MDKFNKTSDSTDKTTDTSTDDKKNNQVFEKQQEKSADDGPTAARYYTDDGAPVEPSTIPPKHDFGEPDLSARPDVHARFVKADEIGKVNKEEREKANK